MSYTILSTYHSFYCTFVLYRFILRHFFCTLPWQHTSWRSVFGIDCSHLGGRVSFSSQSLELRLHDTTTVYFIFSRREVSTTCKKRFSSIAIFSCS